MTTTASATVITSRTERALDTTITINGEALRTFWAGTMVPFAVTYLKPRHVRALGIAPKRGKQYALRDGNALSIVTNGYFSLVKTLPLPLLHINQSAFVTTTEL